MSFSPFILCPLGAIRRGAGLCGGFALSVGCANAFVCANTEP